MDLRVHGGAGPLVGTLRVPSDKSISHRAVLFAAMAEGTSRLSGVLDSADVRSTMNAVAALGAEVVVEAELPEGLTVRVTGWGSAGPRQPDAPIDCGNSGTTVRLLMGVLAGWDVAVTLVGDESLSRRPMRRVAEPLAAMGAAIETTETGTLPVTMRGGSLHGIEYCSPVASAQVKTAVLLAGLRATGTTSVIEPAPSRDHTERLLPAFGVPVAIASLRAELTGPAVLTAADIAVPADPSSAAFIAVVAALVAGSDVSLPGVSVNPTRSANLRVLERMGAQVALTDERLQGAEPIATVRIRPGRLLATLVSAAEVPSLVDEVPVLAIAAALAEGTTRFEGVRELRVKESDRLEAIRAGLSAFGATVRAGDDWLEIDGVRALHGADVSSLGDHRLAMAWAVAALAAEGESTIRGFDAVRVSYPRFRDDLEAVLGNKLG